MPSSPPTFPQEVIDKIVGDLEPDDDSPDLLNCSLVSKSFLAASRRVLFNQLTIGADNHDAERASKECRGLYAIVVANPRLGLYIKRIGLQDTSSSQPDPESAIKVGWISREETLPLLLPLLSSLNVLSIRARLCDENHEKLDWSTFPPSLATALSRTFMLPNLVKIEFVELRNVPSEIVTSSKHLKTLSFWGIHMLEFDENSSSGPLGSAQPIARGQLELLDIINCALIIPILTKAITHRNSSLDLSCLKTLRVGMSRTDDLVGWSTLVDCVSQTIEKLDIVHLFPSDEQSFIQGFPHDLVDLRPFPNLRVFSLDISYYVCENAPQLDVLPVLLAQLRQITFDSKLEEFKLLADYSPPSNDVQFEDNEWRGRFCRRPFWQELDSILTHQRFSKLKRVDIVFKGLGNETDSSFDPQFDSEPSLQTDAEPDCDLEPELHDLRNQIPGLISKNIVFFEFVDD